MAITERYVRADAAGGGDGTTDANSGATGAFTWDEMVTDINTPRVGYRYNVKQGTYNLSSSSTLTGDGTTTSPNIIRGFKDTPGDATLGRGSDGLLNTSNMPTIVYSSNLQFHSGGANFLILESLIFEGSTSQPVVAATGAVNYVFNCKITNDHAGSGDGLETSQSGMVIGNDVYLPSGTGVGSEAISAVGPVVGNNVFMGSAGVGVNMRNNPRECMFNTIIGGTYGIQKNTTSQVLLAYFNTIADCSGSGIYCNGASTSSILAFGNHITGCGAYGIDFSGSVCAKILWANRFRDNSSGNLSTTDDWGGSTSTFEVTAAGTDSDDFTNVAGLDYSLKTTAAGFQKALFMQLKNIGANGSSNTGGGGGGASSYTFIG